MGLRDRITDTIDSTRDSITNRIRSDEEDEEEIQSIEKQKDESVDEQINDEQVEQEQQENIQENQDNNQDNKSLTDRLTDTASKIAEGVSEADNRAEAQIEDTTNDASELIRDAGGSAFTAGRRATEEATEEVDEQIDDSSKFVRDVSEDLGETAENASRAVDDTFGVPQSEAQFVRNVESKVSAGTELAQDLSETAGRASQAVDEPFNAKDPVSKQELQEFVRGTGDVVSGASADLGATAGRAVDAGFEQTQLDEQVAENRFTRKELRDIDEENKGFLTDEQEKELRQDSKAYNQAVEEFAKASGQNTVEPFGSFIEGGVESVGSVGNVSGFANTAEQGAEFVQSGRATDDPFRTVATAGAIGGTVATRAGRELAQNPVKGAGSIAGDIALGAGATRGVRAIDKKARRGSRRLRRREEVDPTDIAEDEVVSGEQRFTEFEEDPLSLSSEGVARRSTDVIDESRTERVGGLDEDRNEAILYSASEADLPSDLDVDGPKNRPSDPEGTLFASPRGTSVAFTGLREADTSSSYTLIPRPSQFRSKSSTIIETKAPIREAPSDVGPESSVVRERPDEEFDLGEESQFLQNEAEEGVAYIRSPANRTSEGEVLFAQGTRLVEDPNVDTQFTDIDRGVADIRTFRNVSAERARRLVDDDDTDITEENVFESAEEARSSLSSRSGVRDDSPLAPTPFGSTSSSSTGTDSDFFSRSTSGSESDRTRSRSRSSRSDSSSFFSRSSTSTRGRTRSRSRSSRSSFFSRGGSSSSSGSSGSSSGGSSFFTSGGSGGSGSSPFTQSGGSSRTRDRDNDQQDNEFETEDPEFDESNLLYDQGAAESEDFFSSSESEGRGSDEDNPFF